MGKEELVDKLKSELNKLSNEIEKLEGKMNELGEDAKVTYKKQLNRPKMWQRISGKM